MGDLTSKKEDAVVFANAGIDDVVIEVNLFIQPFKFTYAGAQ